MGGQKGITLLTLTVTIIVLLVLAAALIAVIVNGGFLGLQDDEITPAEQNAQIRDSIAIVMGTYLTDVHSPGFKDRSTGNEASDIALRIYEDLSRRIESEHVEHTPGSNEVRVSFYEVPGAGDEGLITPATRVITVLYEEETEEDEERNIVIRNIAVNIINESEEN
ncbi:MAG: hypothetical protein FWC79_07440 [Oscillospiraceae bacterium]|nr:hypothetical protein [Oscillospiraceae bacterium]